MLMAALTLSGVAQSFQRFYYLNESLIANAIRELPSGGYVVAGEWQGANSEEQSFLLKLSQHGDVVWINTYSAFQQSAIEFEDVQVLADGGFIISANVDTSTAGSYDDALLVRTDSSGQIMWAWAYGGLTDDDFKTVAAAVDGGFIAAGMSANFSGAGDNDLFVVKTDSGGNVEWARSVGTTGTEEPYDLIQTSDSGYAIGGWTDGPGTIDGYVVKLTASGVIAWSLSLGGGAGAPDEAWGIRQRGTGNLIVAGHATAALDEDVLILELTPGGNLAWHKYYDGQGVYDQAYDLAVDDNTITIGGATSANFRAAGVAGNALVLQTNSTGELQWARIYGSPEEDDNFISIIPTADGGFAMSGASASFGGFITNMYLAKANAIGETGCHDSSYTYVEVDSAVTLGVPDDTARMINPNRYDPQLTMSPLLINDSTLCLMTSLRREYPAPHMHICPNPARNFAELSAPVTISRVRIWDMTGRPMYDAAGEGRSVALDISPWPAGVYLVVVSDEQGMCSMLKLTKAY